jgi:hypothetical protein
MTNLKCLPQFNRVKPFEPYIPSCYTFEYGALTLALYTINKNPGWVPDGGSSDEFTQ